MPKFSIIIPCFNHFNQMERCLRSLEKQTLKDFEAIFIEDQSNDNLLEELIMYQKTALFSMKIIKNETNLGQGLSRNRGIDNAVGNYITFLDADDYFEENTLAQLANIIDKEKPECIIFDYYFETKNHRNIYQKSYLKTEDGIISKENAMIHSTGSTWCKVYLSTIIKNEAIRFPNLKRCEDMVFNKIAMSYCEKIYYYNKALYHYVMNENSIMHTKQTLSLENSSQAVAFVEKQLITRYPVVVEAIFLKEYFYANLITLVKLKKTNKQLIEHITICEKKYPHLYENTVISYMTKFQQICIKLAREKHILLLKLVIHMKEFIKKNM